MRWLAGLIVALLLALPARAQVLNYDTVFEQPTLTGDWDGIRGRLEDQGIQLAATRSPKPWAIRKAGAARAGWEKAGLKSSPIWT